MEICRRYGELSGGVSGYRRIRSRSRGAEPADVSPFGERLRCGKVLYFKEVPSDGNGPFVRFRMPHSVSRQENGLAAEGSSAGPGPFEGDF